jgi:malonyl CoA-acyl carrier protein transacylase
MKVFMFAGQGSQYQGMGGSLFDEFKPLVRQADHILGYSIEELCLEDPRKELNRTQFTGPALYVVNALNYLKKIAAPGKKPDVLAGHGLGEFNALLAAECFNFENGLRLVQRRGLLMSRSADGLTAEAQEKFQQYVQCFHFGEPRIPVMCNLTARPYLGGEIATSLAHQIASTVKWCESIQYLMAQGVARGEPVDFEEVGQGDVLTKMLQTIKFRTPDCAPQAYRRAENRSAWNSLRVLRPA